MMTTSHQFADLCRQLSVGQTLLLSSSDAQEVFGSNKIADVTDFLGGRLGSPEHSGLRIQESGADIVITRLRIRGR